MAMKILPIGSLAPLRDEYLQDARFTLVLDSQDLAAITEAYTSGAFVDTNTGETWTTSYRAPYALDSIYERIA